jgi:hypothetical protein
MITVETEKGERLKKLLCFHEILSIAQGSSVPLEMLKWIDPYGDTMFNMLQRAAVRSDVARLQATDLAERDRNALAQVLQLLDFCDAEPHRYLKFYGD